MIRLRADLRFWSGAFALGLLLLAVERLVLAAAYRTDEPAAEVALSFLHGLRFDASGLAYPFLLAFLVSACVGASRRSDGGAVGAAAAVLGVVALVAAVEVPFFREFRVRLDFVALEYLDDPGEALSLATAAVGAGGTALVLGAAAAATVASALVLRRLRRATYGRLTGPTRPSPVAAVVVVSALVLLARGGFGRPLRPQDAHRSDRPLVNQLDLSGPFTLERHLYEWVTGRGVTPESYGLAEDEADAIAAADPWEGEPVPGRHPRVFVLDEVGPPDFPDGNVVIVLLESFSARHVALWGARDGEAWAPCLDALAREPDAFPFLNYWANGPSTNRALPAVFASFPALPLRIAVTKSVLGQQDFRALPRVLGELGYDSCFVAGGAEEWENLGGWLRQQGFATVVGRADFAEPHRSAPWGPHDEAILDRLLAECDARAAKGPFLAAALTSTNHPPFPVPDDELGRSVAGSTERERAMRYADAALGRFVAAARKRPWAANTLFVLVGDHGFHEDPQAEIDPDRYRVPCVLLAPPKHRFRPIRTYPTTAFAGWAQPASQLDLLPIVVRAVAPPGTRYVAWGACPRFFKPEENRIVVLGPHGGEPVVAALDSAGNYLVERLDGGPSRLYRLVGGDVQEEVVPIDAEWVDPHPGEPPFPNGRLVPHHDPEAEARLRRHVRGLLGSAHRALLRRAAGG